MAVRTAVVGHVAASRRIRLMRGRDELSMSRGTAVSAGTTLLCNSGCTFFGF